MILVTGGTGLVGSHLLYHLSLENDTIRAIYRTEASLEKVKKVFSLYTSDEKLFAKIEWFLADITQVPAMIPAFIGVKQVYHCAAFISFDLRDYREMRKVNIHGTAIMVNLSIDAKVDKLCFVSSIAAVGDAIKGSLTDEEDEWNKELDNSGYSITKYGAEMEIWRASQEGVEVVIVNPGVILGSGFWSAGSGKLFSKVYSGFKYYTEGVTGFVSVQDVVKPMILLMNAGVKNERFILVSENKSFKEIFFLMADAFGKKRPSIKIKSWQTAVFWRIAWVVSRITRKEPLLTKYSAKSAHSISKYSSEKIEETIGYQFESIEKSIKKICKNYPKI
ncbi:MULTISPECIES: SDR family oxidoreductase [unclassified Polaribacter]|uniref:SDR family oxidoreductase n=1 Tax=unclassified Polaribacter TaxID=196858 RepID=UPI0011BF6B22|nr:MULTISPECIES: SDR family oxidoreductase [unclassified Polaribacter]TXD53468.1 NAD-dependent epimerase/dehydratase family protein [Polaribacter sp. IC063]TXD57707.1 NAD-dependent epimerase/dehydratase family protein [Polaribacter sp. IC066]